MATPRFYCPAPLGEDLRLTLPEEVARHAVGALRLKPGEKVTLFNGDGAEYAAILEKPGKHLEARITAACPVDRESPLEITLIQGISSGERMDYTLQKAVELGVRAIQPLATRRSVTRLDADKRDKRLSHWRRVVASACEQCGRNRLPEVLDILDFAAWARLPQTAALKCLLDPEAGVRLRDLPTPETGVVLLAGPEGGLDPEERRIARARGFLPLNLGPRVLRTETAAVAAIAALQTLWGDA